MKRTYIRPPAGCCVTPAGHHQSPDEILASWRWLRLALPDDFGQVQELAALDAGTRDGPAYSAALLYHLRLLRHEVWDRPQRHPPKRPHLLRPSKRSRRTGYRHDKTRRFPRPAAGMAGAAQSPGATQRHPALPRSYPLAG